MSIFEVVGWGCFWYVVVQIIEHYAKQAKEERLARERWDAAAPERERRRAAEHAEIMAEHEARNAKWAAERAASVACLPVTFAAPEAAKEYTQGMKAKWQLLYDRMAWRDVAAPVQECNPKESRVLQRAIGLS